MDPITMSLAASAISAGGSILGGLGQRKQAKEMAKAYRDAINLMRQESNRKLTGLYGAEAGPEGQTTGNQYQDYLLKLLAQRVQERELQAANINNAIANRTDAEARADMLRQMLMQQDDADSKALGNAARWNRRYQGNDAELLLSQAKQQADARNQAYGQSRIATNNNLARIGAGANLNTGSIADQNRQNAQQLYNQYEANRGAAIGNIANLTTKSNMAKSQAPDWLNMLGGALDSGASAGLDSYFNLLGSLPTKYAPRGTAGSAGSNTSVFGGSYRG